MDIAGIDEVGRGPWAGPVVAAAVVLGPDVPEGIRDSKRLTPARRAALAKALRASARIGIGAASVEEIDCLRIVAATDLAMRRALTALGPCDAVRVDGRRVPPGINVPAEAIVKGDATDLAIGAASIVAKVHRDAIMVALAQQFPAYGWERNMGYGTPQHRAALDVAGVTPHHRQSFAPIHNILTGAA